MARGSLQLRHRKNCKGKGKDARACACGPTVYAAYEGQWARLGYLSEGWKQSDLRQFEAQLVELRSEYEGGSTFRRKVTPKLSEYAEQWLDDKEAEALAGRISPLTYDTYVSSWENHLRPAIGNLRLGAVTAGVVRRYVTEKVSSGLSPRTANSTVTPLSAMLTAAVMDGVLEAHPLRVRGMLAPVSRKQDTTKHLEPDEARALLAATPEPYGVMVLAGLTTGFRRGELLGLKWSDVDADAGTVTLARQLQGRREKSCKCGSERAVPLYSGLREALQARQGDGYVFTDADGRPWSNEGPARAFLTDAYKDAGIEANGRLWHALRHTYESVLSAGGVRQEVRDVLMGHASRGMSGLYTHLFADATAGVEAALDAVFGANVNEASTSGSVTTSHRSPRRSRLSVTSPHEQRATQAAAVTPAVTQ